MLKIHAEEARAVLEKILLGRGCQPDHARKVALEVTRNSLEGTYTHGVNRFARIVRSIDGGTLDMKAEPVLVEAFGALESYDGGLGFGIVNAWACMGRAIELAKEHGIACVALRNTNHWMRAATYGYQACEQGMAGICFTNTLPNMPTWGAMDPRLGNNPLVMAFPWKEDHIVVDMAMSQYSYGALELAALKGEKMPFAAGFDAEGNLTCDPEAVLKTKRMMPAGYWKGAALSFVLDIFAGGLSLGNTTSAIGKLDGEYAISQTFIAINISAIAPRERVEEIVRISVEDLLSSKPDGSSRPVVYAGQRMRAVRERNAVEGIPVDERVWKEILSL
ncbi:MAG TPA: 3-dehydro-L-gulonate 2-dehydrogenase [Rectinemataceae bacterium]|nr:3-dehydro-L-gulonate 2-dehydrogenase [Rectinemataceae bacterium]